MLRNLERRIEDLELATNPSQGPECVVLIPKHVPPGDWEAYAEEYGRTHQLAPYILPVFEAVTVEEWTENCRRGFYGPITGLTDRP